MFETIGRSFRLAKLCLHVLAVDKELIMFPVFSSIGVVLVLLSFAGVGFGIGALDRIEAGAIAGIGTLSSPWRSISSPPSSSSSSTARSCMPRTRDWQEATRISAPA